MLLDNFPHRCSIHILKPTKGQLGSIQLVPALVSSDVVCWEQNASHEEIVEFEKRGIVVTRKVYFLTDPGVKENYRITITSRDFGATSLASPEVLEVASKSLPDASAGMGVVYKVMTREQTGSGV